MKQSMFTGLICMALIALLSTVAFAAEETVMGAAEESVIIGTITDDNQIVDHDGQAHTIQQNEQGPDILAFVGKKTQIKGTVLEADGIKTIKIVSYELIEE